MKTLNQIHWYLTAALLVLSLLFFLLWRKSQYEYYIYKLQSENTASMRIGEINQLIGEISVIKERRELRDSLLSIDKKHRENEKIKLLENANDSTINAIIQSHIDRAKR